MLYYVRKTYSQSTKIPEWNMWIHQPLGSSHCEECIALDHCSFAKNATPLWPHHQNCHCILEDIPYSEVVAMSSAECAYSKIDPYLLNTNGEYSHNKEKLFSKWGYTAQDAEYLRTEFEKQGLQKYLSGEYTLGKLNDKGQRISIRIEITRRDTMETVSFVTGWMVCPNGQIRLTTPYGGK